MLCSKRTAAALLLAVLLVFLCGCQKAADADAVLTQKGLSMAEEIGAMAASESYRTAMGASNELKETVAAMGSGDYTSPKAAYRIQLAEGQSLSELAGVDVAALPEGVRAWIDERAFGSLPTQLAAQSGTPTLAAVSIATLSTRFVLQGLQEPVFLLYLYDGAYAVCATFLPGEDGAVEGTAVFLPMDDALRASASAGDVEAWLAGRISYARFEVAEVSLAK